MNRDRKTLFLNRTIVVIMMTGYTILLTALLLMDVYLITNYQKQIQEKDQNILKDHVEKLAEAFSSIDNIIYDVYAYNDNFIHLTGLMDFLEQHKNAHKLNQTLMNRMMLQDDFHGYYIFYDTFERIWYYTKNISVKDREYLYDYLRIEVENANNVGYWTAMATEDSMYAVLICRRDNAAIVGLYNLGKMEEEIKNKFNQDVEVSFVNKDIPLKNEELFNKLDLPTRITKEQNDFKYRKKNHYIYGRKIENSDFWIYLSIPTDVWTYLNVPQIILLFITFSSIFGVVYLYLFIKREYVKPLHGLTITMNRIRRGQEEELTHIAKPDIRFKEMQEIYDTLIVMVDEIKKQKIIAYEKTIEKQDAQAQYLQLQLKPHFYLNSLKTINALSMNNENEKIQDMTMNISKHLRYLLQVECKVVPLKDELEYVKNYIELQKNMTTRPVECEFKVEDQALNSEIPTLCIQTFVENSIKYAKLGNQSTLVLKVSVDCLLAEEGQFLDIIIEDNGEGYSEEVLDKINNDIIKGSQYIGINNLKRRCILLYGEKFEYNFSNLDGAVSELIIPRKEYNCESFNC